MIDRGKLSALRVAVGAEHDRNVAALGKVLAEIADGRAEIAAVLSRPALAGQAGDFDAGACGAWMAWRDRYVAKLERRIDAAEARASDLRATTRRSFARQRGVDRIGEQLDLVRQRTRQRRSDNGDVG